MIFVDASNMLHRYTSISKYMEMKDMNERPIGPIFGILKALHKISLYNALSEGIVVAWDSGVPAFRRHIYAKYKARKRETEEVELGIPRNPYDYTENDKEDHFTLTKKAYAFCREVLHDLLPSLGCVSVRIADCEADDIISVLVKHMLGKEKLIIFSGDRDFQQLLQPGVNIYNPMADEGLLSMEDVIKKYDFNKDRWVLQWLLKKAIVGDKSDDIPGIKGLGEKAALHFAKEAVQSSYDNTEMAISNLTSASKPGRCSKKAYNQLISEEGLDMIRRNMYLMDLRYGFDNNVPLYDEIKKRVWHASNIKPDIGDVVERLHEMDIHKKLKSEMYDIYDSNDGANTSAKMKDILG